MSAEDNLKVLADKSLVIVLAYAPTGLGHLRVTDALYHGLPKYITPLLLGSQEKSLEQIHRIISHPVLKNITEFMQQGLIEDVYTNLYRKYLQTHTQILYQQLITILEQHIERPHTLLVISTHFGLTHQLSTIKAKLKQDKNVDLILVVVVTDDSPQHIWYTPGADLTFVPSLYTRNKLIEYGKNSRLKPISLEVVPYPVSPQLSPKLNPDKYKQRLNQLNLINNLPINVSVPISGAAVGLGYLKQLIINLNTYSDRFLFHIVSRMDALTQEFLSQMLPLNYTRVYTAPDDREVVAKYEEMYSKNLIALEVTKPSEQAFKALYSPVQLGGVILFFSSPLGRQEHDNIIFLRRHKLIPERNTENWLLAKAKSNSQLSLTRSETEKISQYMKTWRGLNLPTRPDQAAQFIWWCYKNQLLKQMGAYKTSQDKLDQGAIELRNDGVKLIWEKTANYLSKFYQNTL